MIRKFLSTVLLTIFLLASVLAVPFINLALAEQPTSAQQLASAIAQTRAAKNRLNAAIAAFDAARLEANKKYHEYLEATQLLEACKIQHPTGANCDAEKTRVDGLGNELRDMLKQIAKDEATAQKDATFKVSRFFSTEESYTEKNETGAYTKPEAEIYKTNIRQLADRLADWAIALVASLAVTALIIGGFLMIISGGDESQLETGKTIFTYSLIGLAVTLLAYGIISLIQSLFY